MKAFAVNSNNYRRSRCQICPANIFVFFHPFIKFASLLTHYVFSRQKNLSDIKPGYKYYKKIDKLNETLLMLLLELKNDRDLRSKVAISIVTYSEYARVKYI